MERFMFAEKKNLNNPLPLGVKIDMTKQEKRIQREQELKNKILEVELKIKKVELEREQTMLKEDKKYLNKKIT